jgi:hypothetical protein
MAARPLSDDDQKRKFPHRNGNQKVADSPDYFLWASTSLPFNG